METFYIPKSLNLLILHRNTPKFWTFATFGRSAPALALSRALSLSLSKYIYYIYIFEGRFRERARPARHRKNPKVQKWDHSSMLSTTYKKKLSGFGPKVSKLIHPTISQRGNYTHCGIFASIVVWIIPQCSTTDTAQAHPREATLSIINGLASARVWHWICRISQV